MAHPKVMNRADLTRRLVAKLKNDEAVVAGIGFSNFDLWGAGNRPQNFYMLGSMGLAYSIALGVALAQPKRTVIALEGDGSLLMQLGALSTVAEQNPPNLKLILWDNGAYQITGGQPASSATTADLVEIARGSGLARSDWAKDESHFEQLVDAALITPGPAFIGVKIDNARPEKQTPRDPVQIRERFMRGIGVRSEPVP
ncbi:thiamine pyrophosphate-dependent enzyme [Terrihabitans soli]|nr:thiamine pyrophosphate-dependent enzyme [Terrihabitans soli]